MYNELRMEKNRHSCYGEKNVLVIRKYDAIVIIDPFASQPIFFHTYYIVNY